MSGKFYEKDVINTLDDLDLIELAKAFGLEVKRADKKSFKCLHQGGLYIYPNENKFYSFSGGASGKAISFVMYLKSIDFSEAVEYLFDRFYISSDRNLKSSNQSQDKKNKERSPKIEEKGPISLPERNDNDKKLIWYLNQVRKIDKTLIFRCLKNGSIYQDKKGNVVFLGKDAENNVKYAALRGTSETKFQGEVGNSDKRFGFKLNGEDKSKVIVVESAIDALSILTLKKSINYPIISLGSGADLHLEEYLKQNKEVKEIILALDNDFLGTKNWGQENAFKIFQKYKDEYIVKNTHSILKDWNEDLIAFSQGYSKEDMEALKKTQISTSKIIEEVVEEMEICESVELER